MRKGLRKAIITFVILMFLAGLGYIANYRYKDKIALQTGISRLLKGKIEKVDTSTPVAVSVARRGKITESILLTGEVLPVSEVSIFSTVPGKVKQILVKEGEKVRRKAVIAYIDRSEAGLTFAPTPIESTIDGVIKSIMVKPGAYITPQLPLFQIINIDEVDVIVRIPERDIYRVRKGLDAFIRVVSYPDKSFKGKVTELSPVVDPLSRTLEARIRMDNRDHVLKPGMFGDVSIVVGSEENTVIVPLAAILERDGKNVVFIVNDNKAIQVEPVFGLREGNSISVRSGIKEGDRVIVIGQHNVNSGDTVKVTEVVE
jgi:multidrug efflux pump subunit AcrA (membrane-fusion protein)